MSAVAVLLAALHERNVKLWAEDERLRYRAPKGALTPTLRAQLQSHKAEILAYLASAESDRIQPIPDAEDYEVSHAQRRLWVLAQLESGATAYNLPLHLLLPGEVDRETLASALAALARRHESLRTTFFSQDGEPRQKVHPPTNVAVRFIDLAQDLHGEGTARQLAGDETARPFDLARDLLWRVCLVRLAGRRHLLLFTIHHIIADGWSIAVLTRELGHLYQALSAGEAPTLTPLRLQYRDYAHWQNKLLADVAVAPHREYWHTQLAGEIPVLNLPRDYPRPALQTFFGAAVSFGLDAACTSRLRALGRAHNASLFMTLCAVVKALLYRYSGQNDIIVGTPVAGREHSDLEDQVGFYLNMLALRDQVTGNMSFEALLSQVRQTATEAYDHQIYPFDKLVNELNLRRDLSGSPLFDVLVILQNTGLTTLDLGTIQAQPYVQDDRHSVVDLTFEFYEQGEELQVVFEYNRDLFAADRIERMQGHFRQLVDNSLADPAQTIGGLNILTPREQTQLVTEFNATLADLPREATIVALFEAQVARTPNQPAVTFGVKTLSYAQLNARANQIAHTLRTEYALEAEDRVGLLLGRSVLLPAGILGILKAGGAYVPIDPAYPAQRIAAMLHDSACKALLTESKYVQALGNALPTPCCIISAIASDQDAANLPPVVSSEQLAYVAYTSGSTGAPKGVMVTHQNVVSFGANMGAVFGLQATDSIYALTTVTFDISVLELVNSLLLGMRVVVAPEAEIQDARAVVLDLQRECITVLQTTPSRLKLLLENEAITALQGLRVLLIGGEALPPELFARLKPLFETVAIWNVYGPTEATIWSTAQKLNEGQLNIGKPLRNESVFVLSPERALAPIGGRGEIYIGGSGVARGYWEQPELTAAHFISSPFSEGERLYRTGDLGRWLPDGSLECLGRTDEQVKIGGQRIELGEIEQQLCEHPAVQAAAAVAIEDQYGDSQLGVYVVPAAGQIPTAGELRDHLRTTLPAYMTPAHFRMLDRLPLTHNGKVNKKMLRARLDADPPPAAAYAPPADDTEAQLVRIWEEVLGVERIGVNANFFDLGGHSLKAMRIIARIQRDLGATITLLQIFQNQTVTALAHIVRRSSPISFVAIKPLAAPPAEAASSGGQTGEISPPTPEELALLDD